MSSEHIKAGIVSCSGEAIPEGTISRLATRRVLELLRPDRTVTICLPLFLAGNEGERNFTKTHPTITVDGCAKQCARSGTEQHSGPVSGALIVSEILGTAATGCARSSRRRSPADNEAVWAVAEQIAYEVDRVLAESAPQSMTEGLNGSECACSAPIPGGAVTIKGSEIKINGLRAIFQQCRDRSVPPDSSGSRALLEAVKIYHRIVPEEEADYSAGLLAAYRTFCLEYEKS